VTAASTLVPPPGIEPGLHLGSPVALGVLFIGLAVIAGVVALSHERERAFSASLIYLALGVVAALAIRALDLPWVDPVDDAGLLEHLTEFALVAALFSTGLKLDRPLTLRAWRTPARLLLLAMPITIGVVALFGSQVMGLSAAAAVLLGASLAPTDPVLAGDIGVGPPGDEHEHEPNFALTAEAGTNDGLAAPFVLLGLFVAEEQGAGWVPGWLAADVAWAIAGGVAIGAAVGLFAAWSIKRLRDRGLLMHDLDAFHAISTALVAYGLAQALDTYGFLSVLVAGLAFRRYERDHEVNWSVHQSTERMEKLLELAVILLLGSLLTTAGLGAPGVNGWLLAVLVLVAIRPLSCLAALARSPLERRGERAFVSWFGVRGAGTIYYGATVVGSGALAAGEQRTLVWTLIVTVALSIVVHGVTGGPALRRLVMPLRCRGPSGAVPAGLARRAGRG
jgi:NhaP-type Na+/H+ or K+/H+ antiporter